MAQGEVDLERVSCSIHADRQAVARCASCGRATCLACAVPFRGEVLCTADAARALGEERPPEVPRPVRASQPQVAAGALVVIGLVLTVAPWHRFGPLDRVLAAWNPTPQPWPMIATLLLVAALLVAVAPRAVRLRSARAQALALGLLLVPAGLAVAWSLVGALDFIQHTPIPYLLLAAISGALIVGVVRLMSGAPRLPGDPVRAP